MPALDLDDPFDVDRFLRFFLAAALRSLALELAPDGPEPPRALCIRSACLLIDKSVTDCDGAWPFAFDFFLSLSFFRVFDVEFLPFDFFGGVDDFAFALFCLFLFCFLGFGCAFGFGLGSDGAFVVATGAGALSGAAVACFVCEGGAGKL